MLLLLPRVGGVPGRGRGRAERARLHPRDAARYAVSDRRDRRPVAQQVVRRVPRRRQSHVPRSARKRRRLLRRQQTTILLFAEAAEVHSDDDGISIGTGLRHLAPTI